MRNFRVPKTYVARLSAAPAHARRISGLMSELLDPARAACAVFDDGSGRWQVELHVVAPLDVEAMRAALAPAIGKRRAGALDFKPVPNRDWVAKSLAALAPVRAGRFVVHGSHDRARVPPSALAIEIEASLAFGTGHHGSTRGCLLALDALARRVRKGGSGNSVLDLGTGSGVLAIAAAKLLRTRVFATDIDRRAVRIAQANARSNRVAPWIDTVQGAGFAVPRPIARTRFDLVLANILLAPLQRLAAPLARRLKPRGHVVLAGLLQAQANAALAAYRAQKLSLERRIVLDGWATLVLARASRTKKRAGVRSMHRR